MPDLKAIDFSLPISELEVRARRARARVHQELLYFFGCAIPELKNDPDAEHEIGQLTDLIIEAAALRAQLRQK
jgi:hypothetical protein